MATFERQAVRVTQGNLTLYLTYVTPRDLFTDNFYSVDKLEPDTGVGFQRILNTTRSAKLARHLTEAYPEGYAHLPTTVFLATDKPVQFDPATCILKFDTELVGPFSVVDGQHRLEGLRQASEGDPSLRDFQLPVTIATDLDATHQMYHFFIVNTTQVPVDPSLGQQITRRFSDMQGLDQLPYMPYWLNRDINLGRDARALKIVEAINRDSNSPLRGRIQMANDLDGRRKVKQSSIVNLIKSEILTGSNPLSGQESDHTRQARILINYLQAVDACFVDGRDRTETVVYKSNGLFFFLGISKWVFNVIYSSHPIDFTAESVKQHFRAGLDNLGDMHRVLASPDWWMPGPSGASGLNRSAARAYIEAFQQALARSHSTEVRL